MIFDILTLKPFHILPRGPLVAIYIRITFLLICPIALRKL